MSSNGLIIYNLYTCFYSQKFERNCGQRARRISKKIRSDTRRSSFELRQKYRITQKAIRSKN